MGESETPKRQKKKKPKKEEKKDDFSEYEEINVFPERISFSEIVNNLLNECINKIIDGNLKEAKTAVNLLSHLIIDAELADGKFKREIEKLDHDYSLSLDPNTRYYYKNLSEYVEKKHRLNVRLLRRIGFLGPEKLRGAKI